MAVLSALLFMHVFSVSVLSTGGADVELECPNFGVGSQPVTLTCFVDAIRASNEVCTTQLSDIVDFQFYRDDDAASSSECIVQNFRTSCKKDPSSSCWCDYLTDGTYVLRYELVPDKNKYDDGSFGCQVTCLGENGSHPLTYSASPDCTVRSGGSNVDGLHDTGSAVGTFPSRSAMMILLIAVWLVNGIHVFPAKQQ
eukprot:GHVL01015020.1.p1 GENE.GHVL01015020.1~~GHVL01015020.1.p1  ORF type:complete len:197 (+),score=12.10 GHVL01015020.1:123-713(+)